MSLHPHPIDPIPEETARVARAAFPKGNPYMRMRDELGVFYQDEAFATLFSTRGQSAESPWRLALVLVMQYAEGLSDRQAADAVRSRIDWKYALCLELTDPGFDYSVLSEFRDRLIAGNAEQLLLDTMLQRFKEKGLLKAPAADRLQPCASRGPSPQPTGMCWGDVPACAEQFGGDCPRLAGPATRSGLGRSVRPPFR
jgi:transposase